MLDIIKKTKSFKKLSLGLFSLVPLLSSCIFNFGTTGKSSNLGKLNSQVFHETSDDLIYQKNNISISAAAKQAPDPNQCKEGDSCYFQYINDRSFSIFIKSDNNGDIGGGYGTGWIIDRELDTNNFYVVSNIHVWNVANDDTPSGPIDPDQQPKIIDLKIGKQPYNKDLGNDQTESLVNSNYKTVKINFAEYFNDDNRILIETDGGPIQYKGEKDYVSNPFYFDITPGISSLFLNSQGRINNIAFGVLWNSSIKNNLVRSQNFEIPSKEYFFDTLEEALKDDVDGIFGNKKHPDDAIIHAEELNDDLKTKIDWKQTDSLVPQSKKRYIDGAVMKITIPDQVLANWFPYFLDPKTYNNWTFPNLAQSDIVVLDQDQKNKMTDLYKKNQQKSLYHAGYPVEQINGNLTYRSKSGPIFKMTKSKLYSFSVNTTGNRSLDHFQCDTDKMDPVDCGDNKVPIGSLDIFSKDEYSTGGGSSGSMVIDDNYNAVAIYWGGSYNSYASYSNSYHRGIQQPLYQSSNIDNSYQIINTSQNYEKDVFKKLLLNHFYWIFLKHSTNNLWNKYQKISDKSKNGLNFTDEANLINDLGKLEQGIKTNTAENFGSFNTDELKKNRIKTVIDNAYSKLISGNSHKETSLDYLFEKFLKILVYDLQGDYLVTPHKRGVRGVNFKKQLQEYFKKKNIFTYNLNQPKS